MQVSFINSSNVNSVQSFKSIEKEKQERKSNDTPISKDSLKGLECLAALLTPHKHYVEVTFADKSFNLTSGIATLDDSDKEVVSSLQIDMPQGKNKADIMKSILRDSTNLKEFSVKLTDGSLIAVVPNSLVKNNFITTMTKDGKTQVIQNYTFGSDDSLTNVQAYKKAINIVMQSIGTEKVSSVLVATQR